MKILQELKLSEMVKMD